MTLYKCFLVKLYFCWLWSGDHRPYCYSYLRREQFETAYFIIIWKMFLCTEALKKSISTTSLHSLLGFGTPITEAGKGPFLPSFPELEHLKMSYPRQWRLKLTHYKAYHFAELSAINHSWHQLQLSGDTLFQVNTAESRHSIRNQ